MKFFVLCFLFLISWPAFSQFSDVIEVEREGSTPASNQTQDRKQIVDSVVEGVASEYIIEMIGREKYTKNSSLIKSKILRETGRFIPIVKNGELRYEGDLAKMSVQLKVSLKNLKSILLEYGLLYSKEGLPVIFPFIQVSDRVHNLTYKWWAHELGNDTEVLRQLVIKSEKEIKSKLSESGFYGGLPAQNNYRLLLPEALQYEQPNEKSFDLFSRFFSFDIYLDGSITIDPLPSSETYRLSLKWVAKYQGTHRVIAEVNRDYMTEPGPFDLVVTKTLSEQLGASAEDLSVQLLDSWQKGTFGAALFTFVLRGPLSYQQLDSLKQQLLANAKYVKGVKERRFEKNLITLEADVTGSMVELGQVLQKTEVNGLKAKLSEISPSRAVIDFIVN